MASWSAIFLSACASTAPAPHANSGQDPPRLAATSSAAYAVPQSERWRATPPSSGPRPAAKLPIFRSAKLKNGLTLIVSEVHREPLLEVTFLSLGGSAADPPLSPGLTYLTFSMLGGGAGQLSAGEFMRQVEKIDATSSSGAHREWAHFGLKGLAAKAEDMIKLVALAATEPRLEEKGLKLRKEHVAASIEGGRGSLMTLAAQHLPALIFGGEHPFGHPAYGTPESIAAIDIGAINQQYKRLVVPERSALVVVGDLGFDRTRALAETYFAGWTVAPPPKGQAPVRSIPKVEARRRRYVTVLNRVNVDQTLICLGRAIPGANEPAELPLIVANELYGGAFESRLQMSLREGKGYTYDASSSVSFGEGAGELIACSSVDRRATAKGLELFLRQMEEMRSAPVDRDAMKSQVGAYPLIVARGLETIEAVTGLAISGFVRRRELDYTRRIAEELAAMDPTAVDAAIAEYLRPDTMQIMLIGDAELIRKDVEDLKLGNIIVLNR